MTLSNLDSRHHWSPLGGKCSDSFRRSCTSKLLCRANSLPCIDINGLFCMLNGCIYRWSALKDLPVRDLSSSVLVVVSRFQFPSRYFLAMVGLDLYTKTSSIRKPGSLPSWYGVTDYHWWEEDFRSSDVFDRTSNILLRLLWLQLCCHWCTENR